MPLDKHLALISPGGEKWLFQIILIASSFSRLTKGLLLQPKKPVKNVCERERVCVFVCVRMCVYGEGQRLGNKEKFVSGYEYVNSTHFQ